VNKAAFFISIPDNNTHTSGEFVAFRLLQLNFLDFCHRLRKRVKRPHDFESSDLVYVTINSGLLDYWKAQDSKATCENACTIFIGDVILNGSLYSISFCFCQ